MKSLRSIFEEQQFANGYELVDGVAMHEENGDNFQIPPDVIKRHVKPGYFVELRIDSTRFSAHEDSAEICSCPSCNGEMTKPILRHDQPESLQPLPSRSIPSRGWGEDFWVRITERSESYFKAEIDNSLIETRLHELTLGSQIYFHKDHILAVHPGHRQDLVIGMDSTDLKELACWLSSLQK